MASRAQEINFLSTELGVNPDDAGATFALLMDEGRLTPDMSNEVALAVLATYVAEVKGKRGESEEIPVDGLHPQGGEGKGEVKDTPQVAQPPRQAAAPAAFPKGYARLWRNFDGEDVEFFITPQTDVEALLSNLVLLNAMTYRAKWLAEKEAQKPKTLKEGDLFTYGEGNSWAIVKIALAKQTYEGKTKTYIEFWAEGRDNPEFKPLWSEELVDQIKDMTGKTVTFERDIVGKFALTVRLGGLGKYAKDVPEKGKKKGDPKDPRYPGNYWQDFVSLHPLTD